MDTTIKGVSAIEIIDSRGNPTIRAEVQLQDGTRGTFAVPSGASTGIHEAVELRDGDTARYNGRGVLIAVENVRTVIADALVGKDAQNQREIDETLLELDGTKNKSKLGANAILSVSFAVCRATAMSLGRKLYNYLQSLIAEETGISLQTPLQVSTPLFNVMNGGAHADNNLSIQEFMVIPVGIKTFREQLRAGVEIDHTLKNILRERGAMTGVGDEGGFAPNLPNDETALDFIVEAVEASGYQLESQIVLGLDVAASEYWEEDDKVYAIPNVAGEKVLVDKPEKVVDFYRDLMRKYPIYSIEDPLAEEDWDGWKALAKDMNFDENLLVGDDLTVTNPEIVERAAKEKVINALIIKPNQIGTLTEVIEVLKLCDRYAIKKIVSHRSGETTDDFIADLAVAANAEFLKDGAPIRGERVAKYNRMLVIESELLATTEVLKE